MISGPADNTLSTERVGLLCKLIKNIMVPVSLFPLNKLDCSSLPPQPSIISYIHCSPDSSLFLCPPKKISICFLVSLIFPRFSKPLGRYHNVELFFLYVQHAKRRSADLKKISKQIKSGTRCMSHDMRKPTMSPSVTRGLGSNQPNLRMKRCWVLSYSLSAQQRLWSDWVDTQAE